MDLLHKASANFRHIALPLLSVLALSYLAVSAYAARDVPEPLASTWSSWLPNPYLPSQSQLDYASRIQTIQQQLEFMVWEGERQQLHEQLLDLTKQQVNAQPFSLEPWWQLSFATVNAGESVTEQAFAFRNALMFTKWNPKARVVLLQHCILRFDAIEAVYPELCRNELRQLPSQTRKSVIATYMGVSLDQLNYVLEQVERPTNEDQ